MEKKLNIREHEYFKGCAVKICKRAVERLLTECEGKSEKETAVAIHRLSREIQAVIETGGAPEVYLLSEYVQKTREAGRIGIVQGLAPYSYLAYLLRLTRLDPLERGYEPEMTFSYHMDRPIFMLLNMPVGSKALLIAKLKEDFGKDLVREDRFGNIVLGDLEESDLEYDDYTLTISCVENPLLNRAEEELGSQEGKQVLHRSYPSGPIDPAIPQDKVREIALEYVRNYAEADPEIKADPEKVVDTLLDGTYEGLIHLLAVLHGTGVWASLPLEGGDRIYTRDDALRLGRKLFSDEESAYMFMVRLRKGHGANVGTQLLMEEEGASDELREAADHIKFMICEGACIPEAQIILALAAKNS